MIKKLQITSTNPEEQIQIETINELIDAVNKIQELVTEGLLGKNDLCKVYLARKEEKANLLNKIKEFLKSLS